MSGSERRNEAGAVHQEKRGLEVLGGTSPDGFEERLLIPRHAEFEPCLESHKRICEMARGALDLTGLGVSGPPGPRLILWDCARHSAPLRTAMSSQGGKSRVHGNKDREEPGGADRLIRGQNRWDGGPQPAKAPGPVLKQTGSARWGRHPSGRTAVLGWHRGFLAHSRRRAASSPMSRNPRFAPRRNAAAKTNQFHHTTFPLLTQRSKRRRGGGSPRWECKTSAR